MDCPPKHLGGCLRVVYNKVVNIRALMYKSPNFKGFEALDD